MKNTKIVAILFLLFILGVACNKDCTTSPAISTTEPIAGIWRINSFLEDSVDLTPQFYGYILNCNNGGRLIIEGNGDNYSSTWKWNDVNHSICKFRIMGCDKNSILLKMDNDWELTSNDAHNCQFSTNNKNHHSRMTWTKN